MAKHGKKYLEVEKLVEPDKLYEPREAITLLKKMNYVKFDPTVEVHMKLGVDPRHADQMVRGIAMLPAGTGKDVKVLVFAQGEKANEAEAAGADFVVRAKPSGSKCAYVKRVVLSSRMSPSVRLDVPTAIALKPV